MKPKSLATRLFDRNSGVRGEMQNVSAAKYQRQVDCMDQRGMTTDDQQAERTRPEKCHRQVNFAFLPERYEPLIEDEESEARAKEERKNRKKEKYKKVKKNVGKALRSTWKCLLLGLHHFALGYSTPISAAANLAPEFYLGRARH